MKILHVHGLLRNFHIQFLYYCIVINGTMFCTKVITYIISQCEYFFQRSLKNHTDPGSYPGHDTGFEFFKLYICPRVSIYILTTACKGHNRSYSVKEMTSLLM